MAPSNRGFGGSAEAKQMFPFLLLLLLAPEFPHLGAFAGVQGRCKNRYFRFFPLSLPAFRLF